jgi:hypothetical protein
MFAEIDADAEIDAPLGRHVGVARSHLALHLDRATNRIDHARELAEQTTARRMDDAAPMLLDLRCLEAPVRIIRGGAGAPAGRPRFGWHRRLAYCPMAESIVSPSPSRRLGTRL